ncbi:hypothetical protein MNBD_GAMMA12-566 [hydrothermal vent metagenome]|uniref:Tripartite ATP-independent periplasmic transporters DctQ component domain-containing protein n=1 Tax=hydrothermal vent metagenome TaxID=652676 RepID=A0A3B0YWD3_9ZZZZ
MPKPQAYISFANQLNEFCGKMVAWLIVAMILVTIALVSSHFLFNSSSRMVEESVIYMFAIVFMVGVSYTLKHNNHVRVDIFYNKMSSRQRAFVDLGGTLLFLVPFCLVVFWLSLTPVINSWNILEGAKDSGGIPALFILKSFLLIMPSLLLIQGIATILLSLQTLTSKKPQQADNQQELG